MEVLIGLEIGEVQCFISVALQSNPQPESSGKVMFPLFFSCAIPSQEQSFASQNSHDSLVDQSGEDCLSVLQEPIECSQSVALSYTEQSAQYGLMLDDMDTVALATQMLLHDFNQDGYPELLTFNVNGTIDYYQGAAKHFDLVDQIQTDSESVSFALMDFNHDGVLDFIYSTESSLFLYKTLNGALQFDQMIPISGSFGIHGLTPWYVNDDPFLDLYIGNMGLFNPDQILLATHHGFETETSNLDAYGAQGTHFLSLPIDVDGDFKAEMYVVNDFLPLPSGETSDENTSQGCALLNISEDHNVDNLFSEDCFCDLEIPGMGASQVDFDNDGYDDLFIAASLSEYLLKGVGNHSFVDTSIHSGISNGITPLRMWWGSQWSDFDNDSLPDVVSIGGDFYHGYEMAPNVSFDMNLFLQQSDHRFVNVDVGLNDRVHRYNRGVIVWDFNMDGVQDILVSTVSEAPKLYLSEGCTENHWFGVETVEGATVEITVKEKTYRRFVSSVTGIYATQTPRAYFGLGEAAEVDQIAIHYQNGDQSVVFEGPFPANTWLKHETTCE